MNESKVTTKAVNLSELPVSAKASQYDEVIKQVLESDGTQAYEVINESNKHITQTMYQLLKRRNLLEKIRIQNKDKRVFLVKK